MIKKKGNSQYSADIHTTPRPKPWWLAKPTGTKKKVTKKK